MSEKEKKDDSTAIDKASADLLNAVTQQTDAIKDKQKENANQEFVDLDSLNIIKASVEHQRNDIKNIFGTKSCSEVVCAQSGYSAKISSLVYKDIFNITNSNLSNYEHQREVYQTIYNKITGFSAPDWHPSFEEWLKATAYGDAETLFYGLYRSTFQERSNITYECPVCHTSNTILIDNDQLIRVNNKKEMADLTADIKANTSTLAKIEEFSSVYSGNKHNFVNLKLPESKVIFSLKLPSLWELLEFLRKFADNDLDMTANTLQILLSSANVFLPVIENNKMTGSYSKISDLKDVWSMINTLSVKDYQALDGVASSMMNDKHITYEIENQVCKNPRCQAKIPHIPLSMEDLLFFQITEKQ